MTTRIFTAGLLLALVAASSPGATAYPLGCEPAGDGLVCRVPPDGCDWDDQADPCGEGRGLLEFLGQKRTVGFRL
ncbi:MAG TPA: hypothetical protein VM681_11110 [Candidatus Thermoplasmatota archaeon]|nr:hypothetical protein [Candidatus Thermoplasmatota archaeon]